MTRVWPGVVRDVNMARVPHLRCVHVMLGSVGPGVTSWDVHVAPGVPTVVTSVHVITVAGVILLLEPVPVHLVTWVICVRTCVQLARGERSVNTRVVVTRGKCVTTSLAHVHPAQLALLVIIVSPTARVTLREQSCVHIWMADVSVKETGLEKTVNLIVPLATAITRVLPSHVMMARVSVPMICGHVTRTGAVCVHQV